MSWKSSGIYRHENWLWQHRKVKFVMYDYINKLLEEMPTDMQSLETTPASSYLYNTDPGCEKLSKKKGNFFTIW